MRMYILSTHYLIHWWRWWLFSIPLVWDIDSPRSKRCDGELYLTQGMLDRSSTHAARSLNCWEREVLLLCVFVVAVVAAAVVTTKLASHKRSFESKLQLPRSLIVINTHVMVPQFDRVALESFWNPNVYVDNAVEPPTAKSDSLRLMKDHRERAYLVHTRTLRGVFNVSTDLPDFPFDIQVCCCCMLAAVADLMSQRCRTFPNLAASKLMRKSLETRWISDPQGVCPQWRIQRGSRKGQ